MEELKQKAEEYCNTKLLFTFETDLVQKIVKMFAKQAYIAGATEATKELQEEVNELKKRFEPQAITEILDEIEENYINKVRLTEAKEILSNILSDNRIMKAQFESEEQAQVWFKHIEQAEAFLKE